MMTKHVVISKNYTPKMLARKPKEKQKTQFSPKKNKCGIKKHRKKAVTSHIYAYKYAHTYTQQTNTKQPLTTKTTDHKPATQHTTKPNTKKTLLYEVGKIFPTNENTCRLESNVMIGWGSVLPDKH